MNSFENFLNDVVLFIKKFLVTFYGLIFRPSSVITAIREGNLSKLVNHTLFFFTSQFIFFVFMRSSADEKDIDLIPFAFSSVGGDSSLLIACILLVPSYFILLALIKLLNFIFKNTPAENTLFLNVSFYYAAVGMLVSTIIVTIRSYTLKQFDPYYIMDKYVNSLDIYELEKIKVNEVSLKIFDLIGLPDGLKFQHYNNAHGAFTIFDIFICTIIPLFFLIRYWKMGGIFDLKYLSILLFSFYSYHLNHILISPYHKQTYVSTSNSRLESLKSKHAGYISEEILVNVCNSEKNGNYELSLNFYFNNKSKNKIYLKNEITIILLFQEKDSLRADKGIYYESMKAKLDPNNDNNLISVEAQTISNFHPIYKGALECWSSYSSYEERSDRTNQYSLLIDINLRDLSSHRSNITTVFYRPMWFDPNSNPSEKNFHGKVNTNSH